MRVKSGNFIHLGLGEFHLFGKRMEMPDRQIADSILNKMHEFDEVIAAARPVTKDFADISKRSIIT